MSELEIIRGLLKILDLLDVDENTLEDNEYLEYYLEAEKIIYKKESE